MKKERRLRPVFFAMNFIPIYQNADITNALIAVANNEKLFSNVTVRQEYEGTAHKDTETIFLRAGDNFNQYTNAGKKDDPKRQRELIDKAVYDVFNDLEMVDRPEYNSFPQIRPLVSSLMACVEGERLGSIAIVKLKPGGKVNPHIDEGSYADYYDRFHIALAGPNGSSLNVESESLQLLPGEAWWFNHHKIHWAENNSDHDRINIIVDIKVKSRNV